MTVKFACAFAAFMQLYGVSNMFILCISALSQYGMHLVKLIERFSLLVIIFSSAHAAQTAAHN